MQRSSAGKASYTSLSLPSTYPTSGLTQQPRNNRHRRSRSTSKLPSAIYDILYVYPASFRGLITLLIFGGIIFWLSSQALIFFRLVIIDNLFSGWLGSNHLTLRKQPLIFVQSPWSASIVWEATQRRSENANSQRGIGLRYWKEGKWTAKMASKSYHSKLVGISDDVDEKGRTMMSNLRKDVIVPTVNVVQPSGWDGRNRWIHSVNLDPLESGKRYRYQLVLEAGDIDQSNGLPRVIKTYGEYEFTWLGINPPDQSEIEHLSLTTVSTNGSVAPIDLVLIGDTHSSPTTLSRLVKKYLNLRSYAHAHRLELFSPRNLTEHVHKSKPDLLIHLGNTVQDNREIKQWQTEFWNPITYQNRPSSEVPIVYARGNHDFDVDGVSLYTSGLPPVQPGELNRTRVALLKNQKNRVILPGITIAERQYTALHTTPRDHRTRGAFFGYSPHPRVRILVLDSNLIQDRQAFYKSRSSLTEVGDHEHWLLWEMARPEWKDASMRIIVVNQAPFVEYSDETTWQHEKHSKLAHYIRTVFVPHFHARSEVTQMYDIPPATMVVSSNEFPAYSRGILRNYVSPYLFGHGPSSEIGDTLVKQIESERFSDMDPHSKELDNGVVYVVTPGSGKLSSDPVTKVENWGFYEMSRADLRQHQSRNSKGGGSDYFTHISLDMAPENFDSDGDWISDSHENTARRSRYSKENIRVYKIVGSQSVCSVEYSKGDKHIKVYNSYDRLYWRTLDTKGRLVDQFVIEASSCRG
ncbi:hypothetical protein BY996DRAFT_2421960 [Phakopsora pachyrhizi]|uniref:Calcineurin-like phosphoesterase domain-containing protein n=1 Tax=Phakopsora pachyrhizi TaxID=170000 RepID=A0AAV0AWY4_PHAPC|nr:hypothetical protein BY996DRAFT_2421960 [Phakopsora pachyrhizi]CAH7672911.1 hypothetical protein PPACK8108_LOCUS7747 [Phakopsora pachyrhizi]